MELAPDKNPDLLVTVSDPQRHIDPIKDYVSYALNTRTNLSSFSSTTLSVRRRYNHFLEFREQLVAIFPALVVPPLPEKMTTKYLDRFNDAFLEKRRRALEQFMNRLTVHPQLSHSDQLRHFLSEENWVRVDDEKAGNSAWMKMSLTGTRNKLKNDPEGTSFENLKNYFIEFHKTLSSIHDLLASVSKKQIELSGLYTSLGESFLGLSEQPEPSLEEAIRTLGQVYGQKQSALLAEAGTQLDYNTVESIKEYVLIGQTALTVLKYRDGPLGAYLGALNDLTDTKAELLRLQKQQEDPTQKRSAFSSMFGEDPNVKINKLQERVSSEELKLSQTRESLDATSRALILEMERLHQYKLKDLRNLLIEFVNGQVDLHKKSAENWEASLAIIGNISLNDIAAPQIQSTPISDVVVGSASPTTSNFIDHNLLAQEHHHQQHYDEPPPVHHQQQNEYYTQPRGDDRDTPSSFGDHEYASQHIDIDPRDQ